MTIEEFVKKYGTDGASLVLKDIAEKLAAERPDLQGTADEVAEIAELLQSLLRGEMGADVCTCTFVAVGAPIAANGCKVHPHEVYACDHSACKCHNYRPITEASPSKGIWPRCMCGHAAQDHNNERRG
jgi:hypothetical protein